MKSFTRFIPLLVIVVLMLLVYLLDITEYLTFEELKRNRELLLSYVNEHPYLSPLVFIGVYTLSTALSIPGAVFLTIFGGFLFPQPYSTLYAVFGATFGAILIFLAAKTALGDTLKHKAGKRMQKMRAGFQDNAANYLLFLRLVPLFPFWMVNLAPAFFGVTLLTFAWTTFVGIIPGAFVFAQAGAGLGSILDSAEEFSVGEILTWDVKIALLALGIFALIPPMVKHFKGKKNA